MRRALIPSYIVAYFISSTIVVEGYSLYNLNPLITAPFPCTRYQYPETAWDYYCYWYNACPQWCQYLYTPRFGTGSNAFESVPRLSAQLLYRNRKLQNTRRSNYSPMLGNTSSAILARLLDSYRMSEDLSVNRALMNYLPPTKLSALKEKDNPVQTGTYSKFIGVTKDISKSGRRTVLSNKTDGVRGPKVEVQTETYSKFTGITKDIIKSGRRTVLSNKTDGVRGPKGDVPVSILPNIAPLNKNAVDTKFFVNTTSVNIAQDKQSSVSPQHVIDEVQITWNISTVPTLAAVTTELIKQETTTVKLSTNAPSHERDVTRSSAHETGQSDIQKKNDFLFRKFRATLGQVERKFLLSAFTKLTAISPENRKENGISFLQSAFLLHQLLMALSIEAGQNVTREIEECLGLDISENEKIEMLERASSLLPKSSDVLKFRWSSRLALRGPAPAARVSGGTLRAAHAARLELSWLNGTETAAELTQDLNKKVELDSGGIMHDTFDEEEFSAGACAAAAGTSYVRATWRVAPTLLNDSLPFRDAPLAPNRTSRFFRLNDVMGYAYLHEWDAEAIEIPYATPGLTLLLLVPKEPLLRPLVKRVSERTLDRVLAIMSPVRLAVTLPLYTLRMTLLLPNKLEDMGMPSLVLANGTDCDSLKFSHAVQRLMFWAEAGRNAFKDDGIEWDPHPELEIVVDRPYLFFVRWQNITIMNGVFVL